MGGELGVRSQPGHGACFHFSVPLRPVAPPRDQPAVPVATDGLAGMRVLVAEDNAVNQLVIDGLLRRLGIEATLVGNGEEAVAAVAGGDYDILLLDCEMPRMDGFAAARHIREAERQRGGRRLPIVAMTAHAFADSRDRCLAAGMDDHLGKPLTLESVAEKLRAWGVSSARPAG